MLEQAKHTPKITSDAAPAPVPAPRVAAPATSTRQATSKLRKSKLPDTPPKIIKNRRAGTSYSCEKNLGEGGFARCFEVKSMPHCNAYAAKVVAKSSLIESRQRLKLLTEIKIQSRLRHPNIVRLYNCFEDTKNVYMILELCSNGSMQDALKFRKHFSEPEARYWMLQLLGACRYMHKNQVIHRDLKLSNIFFTTNMDIRVGDFGLAASLAFNGDRKRTMCGTPNYIAPEVLFDRDNGHSFEVDIWTIGVIMYTMLYGRPPFQMREVKSIYKKIKDCNYSLESTASFSISDDAKDLISKLLSSDPSTRPTINDIASHPWFTRGSIPDSIPLRAKYVEPEYLISREASRVNYENICRRAQIGTRFKKDDDLGKVRLKPITEEQMVDAMISEVVMCSHRARRS